MKTILVSLLLGLPLGAWAQESAQFLKIGVGARSTAMGGAYTAVADDVSAMSWNPAGLSQLSRRELGATHAELTGNTRYDFLGYALPLSRGTLGIGAVHLKHAAIESRDSLGRLSGSYGASDTAVNLSYALKAGPALSFGGGVKYITSGIGNASAQTAAFDFGGLYKLNAWGPGTPTVGLAVQNVGPGMKFLGESSPLPLTVAAGLGYRLPAGLGLALDYKYRPYSLSEVSVGTEYAIIPSFSLRLGYGSAQTVSNASRVAGASGLATGFGLRAYGYSLDYTVTPFGAFGNSQRFSLGAKF